MTAAGHRVTLEPFSSGQLIDVGTNAGLTGTLGLAQSDLNNVTASTLQVGDSTSGNITVSAAVTLAKATTLDLETGGGIVEGAGGALTVPDLALRAVTGVGSAGALAVVGPISVAIDNTTSGAVQISSTGALTIASNLDGVSGVSDAASSASITIHASSPLTVAADVTATGNAPILLSADDTPVPGDDLTVNAGVTVSSGGGGVTLDAGDNVTVNGTVQTSGAGQIIINGDFNNVDPIGGTTITLGSTGTLTAPAGATINGGAFPDTFNVHPIAGTPLTINGFAPTTAPGDVLNLDLTGATGTQQTVTGPGNGFFTFTNRSTVTYTSIETINALNGQFALLLDMAAQGFQDGNATPDVVNVSTDTNASQDLVVTVSNNGGPATTFFNGAVSGVSSFTILGSTDPQTVNVDETNGNLPPITDTGNTALTTGVNTLNVNLTNTTGATDTPTAPTPARSPSPTAPTSPTAARAWSTAPAGPSPWSSTRPRWASRTATPRPTWSTCPRTPPATCW